MFSTYFTRNKRLILCATLLAVCMIACIVVVSHSGFQSFAETTIVDSTILDDYFVGEEVIIPNTATVSFNNETYSADFKAVVLPSGGATKNQTLFLDVCGTYVVQYQFTVGEKTHVASKQFEVKKDLHFVSNASSSITYGELDKMMDNGLDITLARGDVVTFNKPIKLDKNGESSVISFHTNIITDKYINKTSFDCQLLVVTITDCYDPDKYIDFLVYVDTDPSNYVFMRTIVAGQGEIGLFKNASTSLSIPFLTIDGENYGVWKGRFGDSFGQAGGSSGYTRLEWSINQADGRIYVASYVKNASGLETLQYKHLINDYDDTNISATTFPGFTTGEVYVSVTGRDWLGTETKVQISSLGQERGEALNQPYYTDTDAPEIIVDNNGRNQIYMQTGDQITLFDAKAYDVNNPSAVNKRIYLNYGTSSQSAVVINGDSFRPLMAGVYTAEYSAKDGYGNVGKATFNIYVSNNPVTSLNTEEITTLTAGVATKLPSFETSSRNGEVTTKIEAIHETGRTTEISTNTLVFTPDRVGDYILKYTYNDGVKDFVYQYGVTAEENDGYGFIELPILERAYIKNAVYGIDEIDVYTFGRDSVQATKADAYVSFDGGDYKKVQDTQKVKIEGNSTVRFKYVKENSFYETESIKIIDAGYGESLQMEKYFDGDFTSQSTYEYIQFNANQTSGDAKLSFVNRLAYNLFGTTFIVPQVEKNFDSIGVVLSDNLGYSVEILYKNVSGKLAVKIANGAWVDLSGNLYDQTERTVKYDASQKAFVFTDKDSTIVYPFDLETKSTFCNLDYVLHGISGSAGLKVVRVQNQFISKEDGDYTRPQIYFGQASGYLEVNSTIIVQKAVASDALTPISSNSVKVSVFAPDGTFATSDDGVVLSDVASTKDFAVTLTQYGMYRVEYVALDNQGRQTSGVYQVNSANVTAPVVKFKDNSTQDTVQEMYVGYKYNVKAYTVTDDDTPADKLEKHILVYNDTWQLVMIDEATFTPTEVGNYTVYVYCFDQYGNSSYVSYKINASVKEETK